MGLGIILLLQIISLIIWIAIIIYCVNKADDLNRDKFGWGIFSFFFPIIAVIWIQFIDPIEDDETSKIPNKKPQIIINIQKTDTDLKDPLETLNELKAKGIITESEFEEKHKVISEQIRQNKVDGELHDWYQILKKRIDIKSKPLIELALKAKTDGVISEIEYEAKEKEIFAKCSSEILKRDSFINKIAYNNLSQHRKEKVESYLETVKGTEIIVLYHNKIKIIDSNYLQEIIKDGLPSNFQIIFQQTD
jgi:hypothetical protein